MQQITEDSIGQDILRNLRQDMRSHTPTDRYEDQQSLDYSKYVPYVYRTLDRIAYLLAGSDACSAVCLSNKKLLYTHNNPQCSKEGREKLIDVLQKIAAARGKGGDNTVLLQQLQYSRKTSR